ncbi:amidohydrolase family protein [Kangiella sp. TOML190]|uniref:amidohydrolase family protein n=1 Tax=Kangiella sp. TOML190 TaxID=2931351 RepID=UPI00203F4636|nr:amidohydrolase family protein [Kangiella sp. TOML190]
MRKAMNHSLKKITLASSLFGLLFASAVYAAKEAPEASEKEQKWDVNQAPGEVVFADIKVDEGTWMNLDVSPDGKTIAFDMLGDIYTMSITGGEAKNVTNSMAWDMQPRFSPDGKQLSFTSDQGGGDNIWVMDSDGSDAYQVTKEQFRLLNNAVWSPDGNYLAARKHFTGTRSLGAGEIWLYHKSGGNGIKLNKRPNEQKDLGEPAFTADGQYVLFSRDSTPGRFFEYSKNSNEQIYEIFAIDRHTGDIETWVTGQGGAVRPTPSPDGKYLAFVRRIREKSTLYLQDRETGAEFPIFKGLERDMQETWAIHGVYPNFAWMPDSQAIVFWAAGKIHRINIGDKEVTEIPFSVTDRREMRQAISKIQQAAPADFDVKMLRWLQVAPNGKSAIFQALGHIYKVALPEGTPQRITNQNEHFEFYPRFSPNGGSIIYTTWHDKELGTVRIHSLFDGRQRVISQKPGHYINPALSPDGRTAVFEAISGGYLTSPLYSNETGIITVDLKTKQQERISKSGSRPFFGLDPDRIYFSESKVDGEVHSQKLVSVDLSGNDKREHYVGNWINDYAISPDGQWLAFNQRYQVYVTPFVAGGKAIATGPKASNLPVKRFSKFSGANLSWSADSQSLNWSMGPNLYQQSLGDKFAFLNADGKAPEDVEAKVTNIKLPAKADVPQGIIALTGAKIITMKDEQVIEDGTIVIENNRIKAIGKASDVSVPSSAQSFDVKGKTIIPGLIDFHWHGPYANSQMQPQTNWNALASLAFGVTTTHNPSASTEAVFSASEMQKTGQIVAPRLFSTGTILYGANHYITADVNSLDDAVGHLERMKAVGAFSVKSYNQPRRDQRQQVLEAARQTGLLVVPEGGSLFQHNMSMVVDGHTTIEHSLPVPNVYADVKQLMRQADTAYVPTMGVAYGGIAGERYWYDKTEVWKHPLLSKFVPRQILEARSVRRYKAPEEDYNHVNVARGSAQLQDEGVKVLMGAHGQREGLAAHWEMWMFEQGGMTPMEALRTATIDGAKVLGMEKDLGSIEVGKLADLVVLDADPLQNLRDSDKVNMVMINGRLYQADSMNQLAPQKVNRDSFYFEED